MKSAIITGAGGFIGGALTEKLLKQGVEVIAVDVDLEWLKKRFPFPNASFVQASFDDYPQLADRIGRSADVFYHFAWKGVSGEDYNCIRTQDDNVLYSRLALEAAVQLSCKRFIYIGSSHECLKNWNSIDSTYTECSIYGTAKRAGELWCRTLARNRIYFESVLFTNVFGVGDYSHRSANTFISQLLKGESLRLIKGNHLHDWTYIDDATDGLIQTAERGKNGKQYYIGARRPVQFSHIITKVRDIISPSAALYFGAFEDDAYVDYSLIDLDALYKDTGFECKADFKESILKTAEWVKTLEW